ncbi:MAG: iron chelate uptake ABC transporter family permease subunit [Bacteroidota bacterium]
MTELFELFTYDFGIRALWASVMVGLMCGVLGCFIVLRNMALIGDALSHAVLPGVVVGFVIAGTGVMAIFTGAVVAGLIAAILITWIQHNAKTKSDAAIGIVFTAMFSIGVIAISKVSRKGGHLDLDHFLFGNVLGLSNADLYLTGFITVYVLLSVVVFYRYLFATTFQPIIAETMGISVKAVHYYLMLLLAFAIVVSLQSVGVILVVAMLITPASTALLLTNNLKKMLVISALVGVLASVSGLLVTNFYNTTPGPAMAIMATFFYLVAVFFAPEKGLVFRYWYKRQAKWKIQVEDTLKQSLKLQQGGRLSFPNLLERLEFGKVRLKEILRSLSRKGLVEYNTSNLVLTEAGAGNANKLVRAHRLWETYLVEQMGLNAEQIHEDAEKYEHILTEELLDEMDASLGFPKTDPHGSPIPRKGKFPENPLSTLSVGEVATIATDQIDDNLITKLWQLGLTPEKSFKMSNKNNGTLEIILENSTIKLPVELANKINIYREQD